MASIAESRERFTANEAFGYLVIDDLVPEAERSDLHRHAMNDTFFYENSFEWNRVWHPLSGMSLLTGPKSYGDTGKPGAKFPTSTAYDSFFRAVEKNGSVITGFLGIGLDQLRYVMAAYLYRAGWGLPWHEDIGEDGEYLGAFSYYLHREWRGNWGGELMILNDERRHAVDGGIDLAFSQGTGLRAPSHVDSGIGTFILPKPNRLVVMRPKVLHAVNSVSSLAGENMRLSLAGFFLG